MDFITSLTERVSSPQLTEPGPSPDQLETIFKAALRAPDHANLRPWRFMTIENDERNRLGNIFVDIALEDNPDLHESFIERLRRLPLRAPLLVAMILCYKEHEKVPEVEQVLSLGAAGHGILTAAFHLGLGAYWRTGAICFHSKLAQTFNLAENEKLYGFIFLGTTKEGSLKAVPELSVSDFVSSWHG